MKVIVNVNMLIIQAILIGLMFAYYPDKVIAQYCNPNSTQSTPVDMFTVNGNGTVTDIRTGLMWKTCPEGRDGSDCLGWEGGPMQRTWMDSLNHAASHEYAGFDDWRIPNINELYSIVEVACYSPTLNQEIFPNTADDFWSSTPVAGFENSSNMSWSVNFTFGTKIRNKRHYEKNLRLVRNITTK